jgi:hypothetical protein
MFHAAWHFRNQCSPFCPPSASFPPSRCNIFCRPPICLCQEEKVNWHHSLEAQNTLEFRPQMFHSMWEIQSPSKRKAEKYAPDQIMRPPSSTWNHSTLYRLPMVSSLAHTSRRLSSSRELLRPALLLGPNLLIVRLGMNLQLLNIRIDDFLAAVCALVWLASSFAQETPDYDKDVAWELVGFGLWSVFRDVRERLAWRL